MALLDGSEVAMSNASDYSNRVRERASGVVTHPGAENEQLVFARHEPEASKAGTIPPAALGASKAVCH
jgi:hypothetical protein